VNDSCGVLKNSRLFAVAQQHVFGAGDDADAGTLRSRRLAGVEADDLRLARDRLAGGGLGEQFVDTAVLPVFKSEIPRPSPTLRTRSVVPVSAMRRSESSSRSQVTSTPEYSCVGAISAQYFVCSASAIFSASCGLSSSQSTSCSGL
jgi:hypothetical protein